jgi:hypothetical protein
VYGTVLGSLPKTGFDINFIDYLCTVSHDNFTAIMTNIAKVCKELANRWSL